MCTLSSATSLSFRHKPLPNPESIRLLRILPGKDRNATIRCELLHHSLENTTGALSDPYEALSYVWGSSGKTSSILLNGADFAVTSNLHAALTHLRYPSFDRIIWVDAICIDQDNEREKEKQIQLMYRIYAEAYCVTVWLGEEADDSAGALDTIRIAGMRAASNSSEKEELQDKVIKLLERDWFQRIWVLQEIAAAARINVICGYSVIDSYAFVMGIEFMKESFDARDDLRKLQHAIRSVTYLMKGAAFRYGDHGRLGTGGRVICPLGILVDMFCMTHQASEAHDKVYALLGMSSDGDIKKEGLLPDYTIPFGELFKRLAKSLLSENIRVIHPEVGQGGVIKSKGCVLGYLSLSEDVVSTSNTQEVWLSWKDIKGNSSNNYRKKTLWTLQVSGNALENGDLVCLLDGASTPSIIRPSGDFFALLIINASPPRHIQYSDDQENIKWPEVLQSKNLPNREFNLIWDWNWSPERLAELGSIDAWLEECGCTSEISSDELQKYMNEATRHWNSAIISADGGSAFHMVEKNCSEALELFEMALESECLQSTSSGQDSPRKESLFHKITTLLVPKGKKELEMIESQCDSTLLLWAAEMGLEMVTDLLLQTSHFDINFKSRLGQTALYHAALSGHLALVERLLRDGADPNTGSDEDLRRPALHAASAGGHLAIVNRLLQAKADVNGSAAGTQNTRGIDLIQNNLIKDQVRREKVYPSSVTAAGKEVYRETALTAAARNGHLSVVERLLEVNADVNAPPGYVGGTALQMACAIGRLDVVEQLLLAGADVNAPPAPHEGQTALQSAAVCGDLPIVERLLQEKADVNAPAAAGTEGRTALQAAAENGHLAIVNRLLAANANVDAAKAAKWQGLTALQMASRRGHLAVVERLLGAEANVNVPAGRESATALQIAAGNGHLDVVERLLQAKADVNAPPGRQGFSALQAAARMGHLGIVQRLLKENADVNAPAAGDTGMTALEGAIEGGFLEVAECLRQAGAT